MAVGLWRVLPLAVCAWIAGPGVIGKPIAMAQEQTQTPAAAAPPDEAVVQPQTVSPSSPAPAVSTALAAVPSAAALQAPLPPKPDDPRAAKVYTVVETYCARCHQTGKLEKAVPAGGLANILALGEVAKDARLVTPGVPDASRLYEVLQSRHAPLEVYLSGEPGPDELGAVREWIRDIPGKSHQCAGREPIKDAAVEGWVDEALRVERDGARDLRFLSLVNLYNACASSEELAAARQGLTKLMNSLSWGAAPHKLNALDPSGTVLSFRLADFGWVAGHWEILQRAYPKALVTPLPEATRGLAGSQNPIVRGDWLAEVVSDPKLYYQLLAIPQKLADLAKMNGVDIDYNVRLSRARRAVVRTSEVTRGNRLAERHPGARGGFWLVYDFATSAGDQDLFERPLGPKSSAGGKGPFKADSLRAVFTLPNGFLAYALYDASGNRIDRVLPGVDKPIYAGASDRSVAGGACFACHSEGIKTVRDAYRAQAATDTNPAGKDVRDAALQLAVTDGEAVLLRDADNERYRNALIAAGVDPALTLFGEEIITALARRYRAGTDFAGAAKELGLDTATFEAALSKATGATATLSRRLQFGPLPRADIDQLFAYLKGSDKAAEPAAELAPRAPAGTKIGLTVWTDKARPAPGDLITISALSDTDCYLTVINVDGAGKATVIFPNDFEIDNLMSAGKTIHVPGPEAPYQLRRKEEGRELIVTQCSTSPAPPTGVEHEFGRQRFTVLGNWENFVEDALVTEADLRKSPEKAERARVARASALRRERGGGRGGTERGDTSPGRTVLDGRSVLVLE